MLVVDGVVSHTFALGFLRPQVTEGRGDCLRVFLRIAVAFLLFIKEKTVFLFLLSLELYLASVFLTAFEFSSSSSSSSSFFFLLFYQWFCG